MTTKPRLETDGNLLPGLAAVALFAVMAAIFLGASFGEAAGFPGDASITAGLGYALFDIGSGIESEGFLAVFEIIDFVLIAALAGAIMLAKKEGGGFITDVRTDGGRDSTDAESRSGRVAKRSGRGRKSNDFRREGDD